MILRGKRKIMKNQWIRPTTGESAKKHGWLYISICVARSFPYGEGILTTLILLTSKERKTRRESDWIIRHSSPIGCLCFWNPPEKRIKVRTKIKETRKYTELAAVGCLVSEVGLTTGTKQEPQRDIKPNDSGYSATNGKGSFFGREWPNGRRAAKRREPTNWQAIKDQHSLLTIFSPFFEYTRNFNL